MPLVTIDLNDAGRACPYCRFQFQEGAIAYKCDACGSLHHDDCWAEGSGCAMLGCHMNAATETQYVQDPSIQQVALPMVAPAPALGGFAAPTKSFKAPSAVSELNMPLLYDSRVSAVFAALASAVLLWLVDMPSGLSYGSFYQGYSEAGYILSSSIWPALGGALLCFTMCASQLATAGEWPAAIRRAGKAPLVLLVVLYAAVAGFSFGRWQLLEAVEYSDALMYTLSIVGASICGAMIGFAFGMSSGSSVHALRCLAGGLFGGLMAGAVNSLLLDTQLWLSGDLMALVVFSTGVALGIAVFNVVRRDAWVKIASGRFTGMDFTISNMPSTIGSSPRSDVPIPRDFSAAPTHAWIDWYAHTAQAAEGMSLEVDGASTAFGQLHSGSTITVGETSLHYFERPKVPTTPYFSQ